MKRLTIVAALLALAVMVPGAGSAVAAEWLCNGQQIMGTGNNRCKVVSENATLLRLEDMTAGAAVQCGAKDVTEEGWVGPLADDETIAVKFTNCEAAAKAENLEGREVANLCKKVLAVAAVNLPWKTNIEEKRWDLISAGGLKEPGYLVECETVLGDIDDTCTVSSETNTPLVELENLAAEMTEPALVDENYSKILLNSKEATTCTVGGAESGLVVGVILLAALTAGNVLQPLTFDE
jgi:hypothetical protein